MSKKADGLIAQMLGNRWHSSMVTTAASCSAASPSVGDSQSRPHLELIWYSIKNQSTGAALQASVSLQVRGAGGTVFMNVDHVLASSTVANVNIQNAMIAGKRGGTLTVAMNTAQGSVTYSINAAGWIEDDNG